MRSTNKFPFLLALMLFACGKPEQNSYEIVGKDGDGRLSIIDQKSGKLVVLNKSNRVEDVIDLKVSDADISILKEKKTQQDLALKVRQWAPQTLSNTGYTINLSTRYYKDRLLYSVRFSPSDQMSSYKAQTVRINLRDENGFLLERIAPTSWTSTVDDKGGHIHESANGEVPMTLENYLEISGYDPTWSFK